MSSCLKIYSGAIWTTCLDDCPFLWNFDKFGFGLCNLLSKMLSLCFFEVSDPCFSELGKKAGEIPRLEVMGLELCAADSMSSRLFYTSFPLTGYKGVTWAPPELLTIWLLAVRYPSP